MRYYDVKLRINASDGTTSDDLKRWLTCLGPASTVLDVRMVGESIKRKDKSHRCSTCICKPPLSSIPCQVSGRPYVHGLQYACQHYIERPGDESRG